MKRYFILSFLMIFYLTSFTVTGAQKNIRLSSRNIIEISNNNKWFNTGINLNKYLKANNYELTSGVIDSEKNMWILIRNAGLMFVNSKSKKVVFLNQAQWDTWDPLTDKAFLKHKSFDGNITPTVIKFAAKLKARNAKGGGVFVYGTHKSLGEYTLRIYPPEENRKENTFTFFIHHHNMNPLCKRLFDLIDEITIPGLQ